jgi:hypothetical protein
LQDGLHYASKIETASGLQLQLAVIFRHGANEALRLQSQGVLPAADKETPASDETGVS